MGLLKTKEKALDWRTLDEVVRPQKELARMEQSLHEATDRFTTLKNTAEGEANHVEELDLDRRVGRATEDQHASAKARAEKIQDDCRQAEAERKALVYDVSQQRKAIPRILGDAYRRVSRNLREVQLEDAKLKLELAEKVTEIEQRMIARMHSAQAQFKPDDPIRSEAGVSHAGGVERLSLPSLGIARYLEKVEHFAEALQVEEGA